jgi:hypothetical protein
MDKTQEIAKHFFQAFDEADYLAMERTLATNLKSYITNAEGGVNLLEGRDVFMQSIKAMDVGHVPHTITITQITNIRPDQVMTMIEIKAERKGRMLHNHAAFLMDFDSHQKITELHMVEALPAYSDLFWQ